jgi:uncharacterized RmlC-like cupin family protein
MSCQEKKTMPTIVPALAMAVMVMQGAGTPGVHVWKSTDLQNTGKALGQKLDAHKVASEPLGKEGNRSFMVAHREGSGQSEWHEKQADIMFIVSGEVTMIYGGEVTGGQTTQPGEIRGEGIRNGTEVKLTAGDIFHVPARVPHQMMLAPGAQVTYFVTKVVE